MTRFALGPRAFAGMTAILGSPQPHLPFVASRGCRRLLRTLVTAACTWRNSPAPSGSIDHNLPQEAPAFATAALTLAWQGPSNQSYYRHPGLGPRVIGEGKSWTRG